MDDFKALRELSKAILRYRYHKLMFNLTSLFGKISYNKELWYMRSAYHMVIMTGRLYEISILSKSNKELSDMARELYKSALNLWKEKVL